MAASLRTAGTTLVPGSRGRISADPDSPKRPLDTKLNGRILFQSRSLESAALSCRCVRSISHVDLV
jgi:hypothetical protein